MKLVNLTIDGKNVQAAPGTSILDTARNAGIRIPTLCYLKGLNDIGACRMCVVEVEGSDELRSACNTAVEDGMVIHTNSRVVRDSRRTSLELILSDHPFVCPTCTRNKTCDLQKLAEELDISMYYDFYGNPVAALRGAPSCHPMDDSGYSIVRDPAKCIKCYRCVAVCEKLQSVNAIRADENGFDTTIVPSVGTRLTDTDCVSCGQCVRVCPTAALQVRDDTRKVREAIADPEKIVLVQVAPSVRAAVGESFGLAPGSIQTGHLVSALRRLGFDKVFDTNFGADLTIMEESHELLERLQSGKNLPMFTSCCPAWVRFTEEFYPDRVSHMSTCKSPQQMFGAAAKTWYAEMIGCAPEKIVCVSVMPCTAKKTELQRPELSRDGLKDVDISITAVELARMLKQDGIDLLSLPEEEFDGLLGESTGAAAIFGATGGVMEAALRTAAALSDGSDAQIDFVSVRGFDGLREAAVTIGGKALKVAMVYGLANARKLLDAMQAGKTDYSFVEVMSCPGGCVGGGGMPPLHELEEIEKRADAIYCIDRNKPIRRSHENPAIKQLYSEFLGEAGSRTAHALLHTTYGEG